MSPFHNGIIVKITSPDPGSPAGKLANAELCFGITEDVTELAHTLVDTNNTAATWRYDTASGLLDVVDAMRLLDGLRLVEFAIWATRDRGRRYVTFPSRNWVDTTGKRHYVQLLRLTDVDGTLHKEHQDRVEAHILACYDIWLAQQTEAVANV